MNFDLGSVYKTVTEFTVKIWLIYVINTQPPWKFAVKKTLLSTHFQKNRSQISIIKYFCGFYSIPSSFKGSPLILIKRLQWRKHLNTSTETLMVANDTWPVTTSQLWTSPWQQTYHWLRLKVTWWISGQTWQCGTAVWRLFHIGQNVIRGCMNGRLPSDENKKMNTLYNVLFTCNSLIYVHFITNKILHEYVHSMPKFCRQQNTSTCIYCN